MAHSITESTAWRHWVTPKTARKKAVHRWYLFPHSFTGDLVHALVDEWGLNEHNKMLDPFSGAGTTLLAAKEKGIPCTGYDLSPLAVLASNAKTAVFSLERLEKSWRVLDKTLERIGAATMIQIYPELVRKALPDGRLEAFNAIAVRIEKMDCSVPERDFFRLALIAVIPRFSQAVANGGWLRWLNQGAGAETILDSFRAQVEMMLSDVRETRLSKENSWKAGIADARKLPAPDAAYSAVITSPPYPNRHDYTRVFGIELMFLFLDWGKNRVLRQQSFHSHPEARPKRPAPAKKYNPPKALEEEIRNLKDMRIQHMLRGYFLDMHLCLCEIARVCCKGAKIAFVLGNARYDGRAVLVDELTAELGEQAGLACREIRAVRWRGNSAQQMGKYGRTASRESVVMFERK